jgi:hypothetical protein
MKHPSDVEERNAVYRDCAAIAIQVAELREEMKESISSLVKGFHSLVQCVLQHRTERTQHLESTLKQVSSQLTSLRSMVGSWQQEWTSAVPAADETHLVKLLYGSVTNFCTSSVWDRLHHNRDFSAEATMSWNLCENLRQAVPHAVNTLNACYQQVQQLNETNQLLSLRQSAQEKRIEQLEGDLQLVRTEITQLIEQSSRSQLRTGDIVPPDNEASLGSLLLLLRTNVLRSPTPTLFLSSCPTQRKAICVEVVRAAAPPVVNEFREASLRNCNARLRFRLAVCMVVKDLIKFRCRRSLSVSAFHYRALRLRLHHELERRCDLSQMKSTESNPSSPQNQSPPPPGDLQRLWKSTLRATPPTRTVPSKSRGFQQYAESFNAKRESLTPVVQIVTSPR